MDSRRCTISLGCKLDHASQERQNTYLFTISSEVVKVHRWERSTRVLGRVNGTHLIRHLQMKIILELLETLIDDWRSLRYQETQELFVLVNKLDILTGSVHMNI
jgi:hypothetical protein